MTTIQTKTLHDEYNRLTGLDIPYSMSKHYGWEQWIVHGYTQSDLAPVVNYIRRRIKERRREKESLLFRNLIQNYDNFGEDLAMAKAENRVPQRTERDRVLAAVGRPSVLDREPVTPGQVMAGDKALEQFREWRKKNGL